MKKVTAPQVLAAEVALAARERLFDKAMKRAAFCETKRNEARRKLDALKKQWRAPNANDFRLRIVQDDCRGWGDERDMLEEVFGDTWCDGKGYHSQDCKGACKPNDLAQAYIDAWHGDGIYSWGGRLEERNRVTGEWEEVDSCYGFHSLSDNAPEGDIREQLTDEVSKGCMIVYGEGDNE